MLARFLRDAIGDACAPRKNRIAVQPALQIIRQGARGFVTPLRLLLQAFHHDRFEIGRYVGRKLAHRTRFFFHKLAQNCESSIAGQWRFTGEKLIQRGAQAVHIRAPIEGVCFAPGLLRRHVVRGADKHAGYRHAFGLHLACQSEVENIGMPAVFCFLHHDVARFQVAMDEPDPVRGVNTIGNLHHHAHLLFHRQVFLRGAQGEAIDVLHGNEKAPFHFADLIYFADVRMLHLCLVARLAEKPAAQKWTIRSQKLQSNEAFELGVECLEDNAHASLAERGNELVFVPDTHRIFMQGPAFERLPVWALRWGWVFPDHSYDAMPKRWIRGATDMGWFSVLRV